MKTWAKLNEENVVIEIIVTGDDKDQSWLESRLGGSWVESSEESEFRKNPAALGGTYDENADAFIPKKPHTDWLLNESSYRWEAPEPYPNDGLAYYWDDKSGNWTSQKK